MAFRNNKKGGKSYEKTLTFLATLFEPRTESNILATAVMDLDNFIDSVKAAAADCKKRGSDKIQIKVITATKGKGDFWLAAECPPPKDGGKKASSRRDRYEDDDEDDTMEEAEDRPSDGGGW